MNFLAHIYLSGTNDLVKIGNFMADGIRGKNLDSFLTDIKKGILLHREIDTFTDAHPIFRQSTKRLHSNYHHFSGVIVDIFYDHFLAKNWNLFSDENLEDFINRFYFSLQENFVLLTPKTQQMLPYLINQNWLLSYQTVDGIKTILRRMDNRTKLVSNMQFSVQELQLYYSEFENEFFSFFEEIQHFSAEKLKTL